MPSKKEESGLERVRAKAKPTLLTEANLLSAFHQVKATPNEPMTAPGMDTDPLSDTWSDGRTEVEGFDELSIHVDDVDSSSGPDSISDELASNLTSREPSPAAGIVDSNRSTVFEDVDDLDEPETVFKKSTTPDPLQALTQAIEKVENDLREMSVFIKEQFEKDEKEMADLNVIQRIKMKEESIHKGAFDRMLFAVGRKSPVEIEINKISKRLDSITENQQRLLDKKVNMEMTLKEKRTSIAALQNGFNDEPEDNVEERLEDDFDDEEPVVSTKKVQSIYEKEEPVIQSDLRLTREKKTRVEGLMVEREAAKALQEEKRVLVKYMLADQISWKEDVSALKVKRNEADQAVKIVEPRGLFGRFIQFLLHIFVKKTAYDLALGARVEAGNKLDALENEALLSLAQIERELPGVIKEKLEFDTKVSDLNSAIAREDTPTQLDEQAQVLEGKLSRSADTVKAALLIRCNVSDSSLGIMRDRESPAAVKVKKELGNFLVQPIEATLYTLRRAMERNPDYLVDVKLAQLLAEVRALYPDVPSPEQELLSIKPDKLIHILSEEIENNTKKIDQLNDEKKLLGKQLQKDQTLLLDQTRIITENRDALKNAYRLLFVATRLESASKVSAIKETPEEQQAISDVVVDLEEKIKQIKNNLPDAEIRALDEELKEELASSSGVAVTYSEVKDQVSSILEQYKNEEHGVPVDINSQTLRQFISTLDGDDKAQAWKAISALPAIQSQVDVGAERMARLANMIGEAVNEALRVDAMQHTLRERAYDANDSIGLAINRATDVSEELRTRANDAYGKAMAVFNEAMMLENGSDKDDKNAFLLLKNTINSFDDSIKNIVKKAIDDFNIVIDSLLKNPLFKKEISWVADPSIKKSNVSQLDKSCCTADADIHRITGEISRLNALNASLCTRRVNAADGKGDATITVTIEQLIQECKQTIRSYSPPFFELNKEIRIALHNFLSNPTKEHLKSLQGTMQEDLAYLENTKLLPLIKTAGELYPAIADAHRLNEEKAKITPAKVSPLVALFKRNVGELKTPDNGPASDGPRTSGKN